MSELFRVGKPVIGMVHLLPLPGSPRYGGDVGPVVERAVRDALALERGGADGVLVENFGDLPYPKSRVGPETVSAMAVAVREVVRAISIPVGVNVLRNDAVAALAVAHATGGKFVRVNVLTDTVVTDQGVIEPVAGELLRCRRALGAGDVRIFADVHTKHGALLVPRPIEESAADAVERGLADAIVVTGPRTGLEPPLEDLVRVKRAVAKPVLVGSGLNPGNAERLLSHADGAIVGTYFKRGGVVANEVDERRVGALVEILERIRKRG